MNNPQWLELPMSRTNFHGPKDVRAIEVRLYTNANLATRYEFYISYQTEVNYSFLTLFFYTYHLPYKLETHITEIREKDISKR